MIPFSRNIFFLFGNSQMNKQSLFIRSQRSWPSSKLTRRDVEVVVEVVMHNCRMLPTLNDWRRLANSAARKGGRISCYTLYTTLYNKRYKQQDLNMLYSPALISVCTNMCILHPSFVRQVGACWRATGGGLSLGTTWLPMVRKNGTPVSLD